MLKPYLTISKQTLFKKIFDKAWPSPLKYFALKIYPGPLLLSGVAEILGRWPGLIENFPE